MWGDIASPIYPNPMKKLNEHENTIGFDLHERKTYTGSLMSVGGY
jgi:hypothetical protein